MSVNPSQQNQETQRIRRLFFLAFVLNLILAGIKGILAVSSQSLAVTAGAIDSITDSVASLAVFAGILLADRKTRSFPLGLYKIENVLSVLIALFIFLTGYEVAKRAFLTPSSPPSITLPVLLLLFASTAAIFLFGRYALSLARETGSPTLKAEGRHRQADVLANGLVLLASLFHYFELNRPFLGLTVDQWAAVLVILFVLHTGWELLSDGMRVLLDASIDSDTLESIKGIILKEPGVVELKSLIGRNAGRFHFIQADIVLRTRNLEKAHSISRHIEQTIRDKIRNVQRVNIQFEPYAPKRLCFVLPLQTPEGRLSDHFGSAPFFAFLGFDVTKQVVERREVVANPFLEVVRGKGIEVAEWLVRRKVDLVVLKKRPEHKGPEYVFNDAGVEIRTSEAQSVDEISFSDLASG
ncbi:MAG: cation diffusion facilitator family transporter [Desulfovibrionales bacterium]